MKQIALLFLFLPYLALAQNTTEIGEIHKQIKEFGSLELNKYQITNDNECGSIEYAVYVDKKNIIRKLYHSFTEGCAVEDGFSYTEYFDEKGDLIFHLFSSISTYNSPIGYFMGSMYFKNGNLIKKDIQNIYYTAIDEEENFDVEKEKLPVFYNNNLSHQYCLHLTTSEVIDHLLINLEQFSGKIEPNQKLKINNNNVILRKEPSLKSEVLAKIFAYRDVYFIEKGEKQQINPWGEHHWYKVRYEHDLSKPITGWVFGAFIEIP